MNASLPALVLATTLVACGGGGGGGTGQAPTVDPDTSDVNVPEDGDDIAGDVDESGVVTTDPDSDDLTTEELPDESVDGDDNPPVVEDDPPVVDNPPTSEDALVFLSDITDATFIPTVRFNSSGYLAVADVNDDLRELDLLLKVGDLSGLSVVLSEGDAIEGVPRTQRVDTFSSLSMADDGSIAALVTLRGSASEQAVVAHDTNGLRLVARTNALLTTSNTAAFELESISGVSIAGGSVLISGRVASRHSVLIHDDGSGLTVVAESSSDPVLLAGENMPVLFDASCRVILGGGAAYLTEDGTVTYVSDFDFRCPHNKGLIRYRNGKHSSMISDGEEVAGVASAVFGNPEIIRSARDGKMVVEVPVSQSSARSVNSIWQFNPDDTQQLLLVEGETVETPEGQIVLTDSEVDFRRFDWHPNGHYSLSFTDDTEQYVFAGESRGILPYTSFDSVGASSAEFVVSTLSAVSAPYPNTSFYSNMQAIKVLSDGRVVMIGDVRAADQFTTDKLMYISDSSGAPVTLTYSDGTSVNLNDQASDIVFTDFDLVEMLDGSLKQHGTSAGSTGHYFQRIDVP